MAAHEMLLKGSRFGAHFVENLLGSIAIGVSQQSMRDAVDGIRDVAIDIVNDGENGRLGHCKNLGVRS